MVQAKGSIIDINYVKNMKQKKRSSVIETESGPSGIIKNEVK